MAPEKAEAKPEPDLGEGQRCYGTGQQISEFSFFPNRKTEEGKIEREREIKMKVTLLSDFL